MRGIDCGAEVSRSKQKAQRGGSSPLQGPSGKERQAGYATRGTVSGGKTGSGWPRARWGREKPANPRPQGPNRPFATNNEFGNRGPSPAGTEPPPAERPPERPAEVEGRTGVIVSPGNQKKALIRG